jgi:hypothetical protein
MHIRNALEKDAQEFTELHIQYLRKKFLFMLLKP